MKSLLWGTAAVAVVLVLMLSGLGVLVGNSTAGNNAAAPFSAVSGSASALPAPLQPARSTAAFAAEVGGFVGLSPVQVTAITHWMEGLSPAQYQLLEHDAKTHAAPTAPVLQALGLTPAGFNYYCLGVSVAAGVAVGGIIGSVFGAIIGGIVGAVVGYYACQQSSVADQTSKQYTQWALGVVAAFDNELNLSEAEMQTVMSALNVSGSGWQRAADNAALQQLGNASFNIGQDLLQGQVFSNLAPVVSAWAYEYASEYVALVAALNGHGATGEVYASVSPGLMLEPSPTSGDLCSNGATCTSPQSSPVSLTTWGPTFTSTEIAYIPTGAPVTCTGVGCAGAQVRNTETGVWYNESGTGTRNLTGPTGTYQITDTGTFTLEIPEAQIVPTGPTGGWPAVASAVISGFGANPPIGEYLTFAQGNNYVGYGGETVNIAAMFNLYVDIGNWITGLEWTAATQAEAYWSFLRSAGFTNPARIPADCLIPAPYMVFPASLNATDLNTAEWESLYLAMLEDVGRFYNVTLSSTSFCGTQAVRQWSLGGSPWGNLFVNATGYVYLNNGTSPVNYAGAAFPSEKFGNHATWAIGNTLLGGTIWFNGSQQLLLMPTLLSVSIPVGVRYEVPANNPIQIYVVQTGLDLWLNGNGTANGSIPSAIAARGGLTTSMTPLGTATAGDAIYLTSCTVGGTASANCTVTVQTVNVTIAQITCTGPCSQGAPGGTFGGLPNPFAWLSNLLSGLFGGGPLGTLLGGIVSALLILAVIGILAYVAIVEVGSWGSKKRGGSSGGGGTTVITTGRR